MTKAKCMIICLCLILPVIALSGCERSYERDTYEEKLDIGIEGDPISVGAVEDEIAAIVHEYDEDGILTYAQAVFNGSDEILTCRGTIYYTYCSQDEESGRATTIVVTYDMKEGKATKLSYDNGLGKLDESLTEPIYEGYRVLFTELFDVLRATDNFSSKMGNERAELTIEFDSEKFNAEIK